MPLHKPKQLELYQKAKDSFISLIKQTAYGFIVFFAMLLLTRGNPSSLVIRITFVANVVLVAYCEKKRLTGR